MKLSDYLNSINYTKENLFKTDDETVEKEYVPFIVNRSLSYFPDTIFQCNQINCKPSADKRMHYDYLLHSTRPRKRFSRWAKKDKMDKIDVIKKYYNISNRKAEEVLGILTKDQVSEIESFMNVGGHR